MNMQTMESSRKQIRSGSPRFRVLDPELPLLAARAALQLDRIIHGRQPTPSGSDDISKLSEIFTKAGYSNVGENQLKSLIDPISVDVFTKAYSRSTGTNLQSWKDLQDAINRVVTLLSRNDTKAPIEQFTALRDFCFDI